MGNIQDMQNQRKCLICRHHDGHGQCLRLSKPCKEVQDDSLFDPCGVCQVEGGGWEVERKKDRAKKKLRAE
jgi:hypothetical protein